MHLKTKMHAACNYTKINPLLTYTKTYPHLTRTNTKTNPHPTHVSPITTLLFSAQIQPPLVVRRPPHNHIA